MRPTAAAMLAAFLCAGVLAAPAAAGSLGASADPGGEDPGGLLSLFEPEPEPPPRPDPGPLGPAAAIAGHARYAIGSRADLSALARTGARHRVIVLQAWEHARIPELRRANPEVRVLVYKNLSMAIEGRGPEGLSSTGVNADEAPDDWYLKDANGSRFTSSGFDFLWAMDVGNPAYRRRWADNVGSEVARNGWDGVFLDDVNPTLRYHHPDPATIRRYPSDEAYADATLGALANIAPRLRAAGRLAVANIGAWVEYPREGSAFLGHLDGAMDEMFTRYAGGEEGCAYRDESQWKAQLAEVREAERRGKAFIGLAQACADDAAHERDAAARFGYATVLLGAEGRALFLSAVDDYDAELWYPGYELGRRIGRPTGPARRLPDGLWRRAFERGVVLVNPQDSARAASFDGPHRGWGLAGVASGADLPPKSALILERAGR